MIYTKREETERNKTKKGEIKMNNIKKISANEQTKMTNKLKKEGFELRSLQGNPEKAYDQVSAWEESYIFEAGNIFYTFVR